MIKLSTHVDMLIEFPCIEFLNLVVLVQVYRTTTSLESKEEF